MIKVHSLLIHPEGILLRKMSRVVYTSLQSRGQNYNLTDYVYFRYLCFTNVVVYAPLSRGIFRIYSILKIFLFYLLLQLLLHTYTLGHPQNLGIFPHSAN